MAFKTSPISKINSWRHLFSLLAPYSWQIALFLVLGVLASLVEGLGIGMMIPLLQGKAPLSEMAGPVLHRIDALVGAFPAERRNSVIAGIMLAAILLKSGLAYAYTCLVAWIGNSVLYQTQIRLFSQILAVSQEYLDGQQGGALLRTLTVGGQDAARAVNTLLWLLLNICTLLVFSALLMVFAWQMTLAVVAILLLLSRLVRLATREVGRIGHRGLGVDNELSQMSKEGLLGIRTIRAFGREQYEWERFAAASRCSHQLKIRQDLLVSLTHPLSEGLAAAVMVGLIFLALQANFSVSVLVAMAFMLYRLQPQLQAANVNLAILSSLNALVEAVMALLDEKDKPYLHSGSRPCLRLIQGIRFEEVSFSYGEREAVLKGIDLEIAKGKTMALVGRSGAGKSTLIHLLCRFYDPTSGSIRVDGIALPELDLASWRGRIALVSQDVHIASSTVRENIAYGKLDATDAEIARVAAQAHAHEFIMALPHGYDTLVGDRGMRLSGGQRQCLSIARAILRDPEILILDEATNALDTLSEAHIQAAIEELGQSRTVIVVAHRLSTIERADRIVVLDEGRVAEQGRFGELLERGGLFATLYRSHRLGIAAETISAPPLVHPA